MDYNRLPCGGAQELPTRLESPSQALFLLAVRPATNWRAETRRTAEFGSMGRGKRRSAGEGQRSAAIELASATASARERVRRAKPSPTTAGVLTRRGGLLTGHGSQMYLTCRTRAKTEQSAGPMDARRPPKRPTAHQRRPRVLHGAEEEAVSSDGSGGGSGSFAPGADSRLPPKGPESHDSHHRARARAQRRRASLGCGRAGAERAASPASASVSLREYRRAQPQISPAASRRRSARNPA